MRDDSPCQSLNNEGYRLYKKYAMNFQYSFVRKMSMTICSWNMVERNELHLIEKCL